ncbi:acyl-CoA dehydrogenase family protein [Nocardia implantans]|uniref:Acyl-CoA dehydrogenase family protein n=1 Tax=Nocardia implantans TaxID=3108168 RepID=A0ABU6B245_9NOCA|nr:MULTISPECIES: acyl-CoA dehydrogenase family protein [unclassified Nocardia]MBF6194968.1 acyl-CoA dehydrogenase family protein [Nocardia beijingensis]MEA3530371.1 acyl-CoA dehydrogenase family protein [Nocardia sp. CDC192]MEB3513769.1 acyl-CoA dehydrogenase family protein [Nocardia sp. CDC186]
MDFDLTDEQVMLRDTVRDLLARNYDAESRLKVVDSELGWSRDVWRQLAELGVLGLSFAEEDGGVGAGPVETMVVLEEVGRRLAPEPILDAVLVPGGLVAAAGSAEQRQRILPEVASGAKLLAFAHAEPGVRWPAAELATTATAQGGSYTLTGVKNPVAHGDSADELVVSAALPEGGVGLFLVAPDAAGVVRKSYRTVDGQRGAQLELTDAPAERLGEADATGAIESVLTHAQASLCAESVGAMEEALRLTTDYLKQRKQFGVTLSKFQTLTQRAANMYVSLELARSMSLYATASLADGAGDPVIASRARLQVGRAARHIGQEAIQMHGGIGVTAEYPVSHYVARLTAIERTLGSGLEHLRVLSSRVGEYELPEL